MVFGKLHCLHYERIYCVSWYLQLCINLLLVHLLSQVLLLLLIQLFDYRKFLQVFLLLFLLIFLYVLFRLQSGHFSFIIVPSPPQLGHVLVVCICPSIVETVCFTVPVPLHAVHFSAFVPGLAFSPWQVGHSSSLYIDISFSTPKYDSSKVMLMLYFKSLPF